jgi:hypothetical protein
MTETSKTRRSVLGGAGAQAPASAGAAPAAAREAERARKARQPELSVVVVEDADALAAMAPAWQALADAALEPNPFYEPWMLLPAIRAYGSGRDLRFVCVQGPDPSDPSAPPVLCGLFPLERRSRYAGLGMTLPLASLSLWRYPFSYVLTPLLRADLAAETLAAFFAWLAAGSHGCRLMEFYLIAGDGGFWQRLLDHCDRHERAYYVSWTFLRPLFQPGRDVESDARSGMQPGRWRELGRHERRLADAGPLEYAALGPGDDVDAWIEEFLRVEAISWKGRGGRALSDDEVGREYFRTVARAAFARGQLMMLALRLNGRAIAHKCNFLAGPGSFAIKIAFDEEHARHSPGLLLEIENIRQVHARPEIRWMDSCADVPHAMLDRLWPGRRTVQTVVVGAGGRLGDWVVAAMPLLRLVKRRLSARRGP